MQGDNENETTGELMRPESKVYMITIHTDRNYFKMTEHGAQIHSGKESTAYQHAVIFLKDGKYIPNKLSSFEVHLGNQISTSIWEWKLFYRE